MKWYNIIIKTFKARNEYLIKVSKYNCRKKSHVITSIYVDDQYRGATRAGATCARGSRTRGGAYTRSDKQSKEFRTIINARSEPSSDERGRDGRRAVTQRHCSISALSPSRRLPRPARRPPSGIRTKRRASLRSSVYVRPLAAQDESPHFARHSVYYAVATTANRVDSYERTNSPTKPQINSSTYNHKCVVQKHNQ